MLSTMRQHSRSLLIYILFGIVIAVFIINFGPGSKGCGGGISQTYAARVGSQTVPEQDFVHAFQLLGYDQEPNDAARARRTREFLMELMIRRELLAQEAERLGFRVTDEEVEDRIAQGRIVVVGAPRNITMDPRFGAIWRDGRFDYDKFKQNFCTYFLHTTPRKFIDEQKRELLADKLKEMIRVATKVGPDEVKRDYIERETQVKLKFVRFGARRFEDTWELPTAEVNAWLAKNQTKVKEQYDQRSFMYKDVPKEWHVRGLLVSLAKDAAPAEVARAEGKARATLDRVTGGADLAKLARESSDDDKSKARGGDLGWIRKGALGYGPTFEEKVLALKAGDAPVVVRTDRGFWVARVEGLREGTLGFDQVSHELAEDMLRRERGGAKAKAEADAVMAKVKAGGKLEELFPKAEEVKDDAAEAGETDKGKEAGDKGDKGDKTKKAAKKTDPNAPHLQETTTFPRRGNALEDIGVSKEAADKVFGSMKKGEVAGPFEIAGGTPSYVIVELAERKDADLAEFEKKKDDIAREVAASKWGALLSDLAHRRCIEARDAGRIQVNNEVLSYGGSEESMPYQPCTGFGLR
jgi:peptidyl-prolyl cis-trans isomerase D